MFVTILISIAILLFSCLGSLYSIHLHSLLFALQVDYLVKAQPCLAGQFMFMRHWHYYCPFHPYLD